MLKFYKVNSKAIGRIGGGRAPLAPPLSPSLMVVTCDGGCWLKREDNDINFLSFCLYLKTTSELPSAKRACDYHSKICEVSGQFLLGSNNFKWPHQPLEKGRFYLF